MPNIFDKLTDNTASSFSLDNGKQYNKRSDQTVAVYDINNSGGGGNLFFAHALFVDVGLDPIAHGMSHAMIWVDEGISNYNTYAPTAQAPHIYPTLDDIDTTKQYRYISSGLDYIPTKPGMFIPVASDSNLPSAESCVIGRGFYACIRQSKLVLFAAGGVGDSLLLADNYPTLPMCLQQI